MTDTDQKKFNETLRRMLNTPPKQHEKKGDPPVDKKPAKRQKKEEPGD